MLRGHQIAIFLLAVAATLDGCAGALDVNVNDGLQRPVNASAIPDLYSFLQVELQVNGEQQALNDLPRTAAPHGALPTKTSVELLQTQPATSSFVIMRALAATRAMSTLIMVIIIIFSVGGLACCLLAFEYGRRQSSKDVGDEVAIKEKSFDKDPFLKPSSPQPPATGSARELENVSNFSGGPPSPQPPPVNLAKMTPSSTREPLIAFNNKTEILCPELVVHDEEMSLSVHGPLLNEKQEQVITVTRMGKNDHPILRVVLSENLPDGGASVETSMDLPIAFLATSPVLDGKTRSVQIWADMFTGDPRSKPFAEVESDQKGFHFEMKSKGKVVLNMYRTRSDVMNVFNSNGLVATVDERARGERRSCTMRVGMGCDVSLVVCALIASHKIH